MSDLVGNLEDRFSHNEAQVMSNQPDKKELHLTVTKLYEPCGEKTCPAVWRRSDTNLAVHPQKMARGLKYQM